MKNPFGITERKCKKSDFVFFRNILSKTLRPYVEKFFPFDFNHVRTSFNQTYKGIVVLMKGKRRIGVYQLKKGKNLEIMRFS